MRRSIPVLFGAVILVGCTSSGPGGNGPLPRMFGDRLPPDVSRALADADEVTLFSLDPSPLGQKDADTSDKTFHGNTVLGSVAVRGEERRVLVAALKRGVADHDGSVAACFIPHHGLRMKAGANVTELVICFKCAQVKVYSGRDESSFLISTSPRDAFNGLLDRAKVPVTDAGRR